MKIIVPNYYKNFKCIADRCQHNCCIGWEIDIDEDTYHRYSTLSGPFGARMQSAITHDDTPHFILAEKDRCPFLNQKGLCDIITELGEDHLCQICQDHPRFRNEFTTHIEMGLGLCCEEAARLILTLKEPTKLPLPPQSNSPDEVAFFQLRDTLFSVLQDRSFSMKQRLSLLLHRCNCSLSNLDWRKIYRSLERLDSAWDHYLDRFTHFKEIPAEWEIPLEQLAVYFFYRHLPDGLADGRMQERIVFCILSVKLVAGIFLMAETPTIEELIEIARLYSAEIEYSDENIEKLLDILAI